METITTTQAAQRAGVTVATIRTWARYGAITATKVSGRWNIDEASLTHRIELGRKIVADELTFAEKLVKIGGSRWIKNDMDRIYFNDWAKLAGLDYSTYNTGNISSAAFQGERISNSQANKILASIEKFWFDLNDERWHCRYGIGGNSRVITRDDLFQAAIDGAKAAVKAL